LGETPRGIAKSKGNEEIIHLFETATIAPKNEVEKEIEKQHVGWFFSSVRTF
jgi:hypothetical protein